MMKGEINPSCNNIPMIRFIVADDSGAMQGVAFSSVAEALSTQFEVIFFMLSLKLINIFLSPLYLDWKDLQFVVPKSNRGR